MAARGESQLLQLVAERQADLLRVTQALVQENSTNPPGDVSKVGHVAAELIKEFVPDSDISIHESSPGVTNVVAVIRGHRPGGSLVFNGHLDTYPIGDASKWSMEPLSGSVSDDNDRLYGRGASDMKGGIAASIIAVSVLASQAELWDGEIVLALAGDEETMGTLGSAHLLDTVDAVKNADAMVCGDAGSPLVVRAGEKGFMWLEVVAEGVSAHGAHVHKGVNAISRLLDAMAAVKQIEEFPVEPSQEVTDAIVAAQSVSEPLSGAGEADTLQRISVNFGSISGGTSMNLIPDSARATADIRLPMGVSVAALEQQLGRLLDVMEGISYRIVQKFDPTWTSPAHPIVQHSLAASARVTGAEAVVNMRVGASDSRLFRACGVPAVVVGLTPYNMGNYDEYVMVKELQQVAQIHALIAHEFLKRS